MRATLKSVCASVELTAMINWFAIGLVLMQLAGGAWYIWHARYWYGTLWVLYAITNCVLITMEMCERGSA